MCAGVCVCITRFTPAPTHFTLPLAMYYATLITSRHCFPKAHTHARAHTHTHTHTHIPLACVRGTHALVPASSESLGSKVTSCLFIMK